MGGAGTRQVAVSIGFLRCYRQELVLSVLSAPSMSLVNWHGRHCLFRTCTRYGEGPVPVEKVMHA